MDWENLIEQCGSCEKCELSKTRKNVVFGVGKKDAALLFVGEGPGEQEDIKGEPFVGLSGQLFTRMLNAIELTREDVYIANIVKCRPPQNRDPSEKEKEACIGYLYQQIELIKPRLVVCLGRVAAQAMIDKNFKITRQRGQWSLNEHYEIMATYHPSALLRDIVKKKPAWEDFKSIKHKLKLLETK